VAEVGDGQSRERYPARKIAAERQGGHAMSQYPLLAGPALRPFAPPSAGESASARSISLLEDLQGNILKGHGRKHMRLLFLRFGEERQARALLAEMSRRVTSALEQLDYRERFVRSGGSRGAPPFVGLALSVGGYEALAVPAGRTPADAAFRVGFRRRYRNELGFGDRRHESPSWTRVFTPVARDGDPPRVDAVLPLAYGNDVRDDRAITALEAAYRSLVHAFGAAVVGSERGRVIEEDGVSVEPFGYADGRSQPVYTKEDVASEPRQNWDAARDLDTVLSNCPSSGNGARGSYFVFEKLEQDVEAFQAVASQARRDAPLRARVEAAVRGFPDLAEDAQDRLLGDYAGSDLIGRFKDGTPRATRHQPIGRSSVSNDFIYEDPAIGPRCPAGAHVRVANPRGGGDRQDRFFPRRGIPYREPYSSDAYGAYPDADRDAKVRQGLLFMCYNADIGRQFETVQRDLNAGDAMFQHASLVTLRGGEYFFTPSISGLRNLGDRGSPAYA
jgi:Dyp-type peroxidase family